MEITNSYFKAIKQIDTFISLFNKNIDYSDPEYISKNIDKIEFGYAILKWLFHKKIYDDFLRKNDSEFEIKEVDIPKTIENRYIKLCREMDGEAVEDKKPTEPESEPESQAINQTSKTAKDEKKPEPKVPNENIFKKEGDIWIIGAYEIEDKIIDRDGLFYIHNLLSNPYDNYAVEKLYSFRYSPKCDTSYLSGPFTDYFKIHFKAS